MLLKEHQLSCGRLRLAALSNCDWTPDKPPVICLHGWLDNAASFVPLMRALPHVPFLAIDWPGHGHSHHLGADSHYHFVDYVGDLYELITAQGWDKVDIVGHSMGGLVASVFAGTFPEKLNRLAMIEACGPMSWPDREAPQILRKAVISRRKLADKQLTEHATLASAVAARQAAGDLGEESARLLVERGLKQRGERFVWRSDPRLRTFSALRMTEQQAQAFIQATTASVLVIHGDTGFDMVKQAIAQRSKDYQLFQLSELEGGHHLHMDNAEKVGQRLADFLSLE